MRNRGFYTGSRRGNSNTLIEFLIKAIFAVVLLVIIVGSIIGTFMNNMSATEARAEKNAMIFVEKNQINVKRMTCAGDSDNDGYGSCAITTAENERINLRCPSDFVSVAIFGAKGCKEVFYDVNMK